MKKNHIKIITQAVSSAIFMTAAGQAAAFDFNVGGIDASVYGYARFNASYDIDEAYSISTRAGDFGSINTGAAEDDEVTGHFGADAVQSRLGITTMLPNDVKINLEGDFRPGTVRLRHAYGEYMGVLAGQTWSNFTSFVGYTSSLDFDGLVGLAGLQGRVAQLRYTTGPLSVSLEDPRASQFESTPGTIDPDTGDVTDPTGASFSSKKSLPTATVRYESEAGPLAYSVAGVVQQVDVETAAADDSAVGGAVFGAFSFTATDIITLNAVLTYSNGANAYLYRSGNNGFAGEDAYIYNGDLETLSGFAANVGASVKVGPQGTVNVGYGFAEVDWDDAEDDLGAAAVADRHETNSMAIINYQFAPTAGVMYGIEYAYHKVEEVGGDDGDASKIQIAAQYNF